jgi:hypothetical protein
MNIPGSPGTQREQILERMSQAAFQLIKIVELAKSGICDGDGAWHGSDPVGGIIGDLVALDKQYGDTWKSSDTWPKSSGPPWWSDSFGKSDGSPPWWSGFGKSDDSK